MGSDGQTVLILAGTGTTKFSGRLFPGVNSYFGDCTTIFLGGFFWMVTDRPLQKFWVDCFEE